MARGTEGRRRAGARAIALPGRAAVPERAGWLTLAGGWIMARLAEEAEAGRPALWLPVAFCIGVMLYFSAAHEPELWAAALFLIAAAMGVFAARKRFLVLGAALGFAACAGGFLAGKLATLRAEAPVLARPMTAEVTGRVTAIDPRAHDARRLTIEVERFGTLGAAERPGRVRATVGKSAPAFTAGDRIALKAFWRPPQGPVRPGGYDFARVAFFDGIGATGTGASGLKNLGPAPDDGVLDRASAALERLRETLTARIRMAVGGAEGTVAAALVTGVRGPIPDDVDADLRAAGLSHILSISGLHMALVAGTLFWLARAALALSAHAALRWQVKSIAAVVALAGAAFYLALSGAEVATQRSFVMIAIVFAAVLAARPAVTPRNLALAALAVMALTPAAALGPSFQMSFAAVAGLVAWFEGGRDREQAPEPETRTGRAAVWARRALVAAVMTTVVAGLATAPYAAYHFHRVTPYALAGNLLALPLISLVVMPCVVGGLLFAPLGLDAPWWSLMGFGVEGVIAVARFVAAWPGAEREVAAFGTASLLLFSLGIAWLCLWRTALRWGAVAPLGLAFILAADPPKPDVTIDPSGRSIAVRGPDGALALVGARPSSFAAKVWMSAEGRGLQTATAAPDVACDALGCIAPLAGGGVVALVWDSRAFEEDCRRAELVVTRLDAPPLCSETAAVVDRKALAVTGALSLKRDGAGFSAIAALDPAGRRPWSGPPPRDPPPEDALRLRFAARAAPPAVAPAPVDPTDAEEGALQDAGVATPDEADTSE